MVVSALSDAERSFYWIDPPEGSFERTFIPTPTLHIQNTSPEFETSTDPKNNLRDLASSSNQLDDHHQYCHQTLNQMLLSFLSLTDETQNMEYTQLKNVSLQPILSLETIDMVDFAASEQISYQESDTSKALEHVFELITHYYRWCCGEDIKIGPTTIFTDLNGIAGIMSKALTLGQPLLHSLISDEILNANSVSCARFCSLWAEAAQGAVHQKFDDLHKWTQDYPGVHLEPLFTTLACEIEAMAPRCPIQVQICQWKKFVPCLTGPNLKQESLKRLAALHEKFQRTTYTSEIAQLWLLVWRSLKHLYSACRSNNFVLPKSENIIESLFFNQSSVLSDFETIFESVDCLKPRQIEYIVGDYCEHVENFRQSTDMQFYYLRAFPESPVPLSVCAYLTQFSKEQTITPRFVNALHRVVIRLNSLTSGPAVIRRWKHVQAGPTWNPTSQSGESYVGATNQGEKLTSELSAIQLQRLNSETQKLTKTLSTSSRATNVRRGGDALPKQNGRKGFEDNTESDLHSLHIESAFDYVHYPFPDTRANEVAMSQQISKDLHPADSKYTSAKIEHIINIPPHHVSLASQVSPWKRYPVNGPLTKLLKLTATLFSSKAPTPGRKTVARPQITPRKSEHLKPRSIISPVIASENRVTKPRLPITVPKLRGSSGRNNPARLNGYLSVPDSQDSVPHLNGDMYPNAQQTSFIEYDGPPPSGTVRQDLGSSFPPDDTNGNFAIFEDPHDTPDQLPGTVTRSPSPIAPTSAQPPLPNGTGQSSPSTIPNGQRSRSASPFTLHTHDSNEENRTPRQQRVHGPCHECPQFPGLIHHSCAACPVDNHLATGIPNGTQGHLNGSPGPDNVDPGHPPNTTLVNGTLPNAPHVPNGHNINGTTAANGVIDRPSLGDMVIPDSAPQNGTPPRQIIGGEYDATNLSSRVREVLAAALRAVTPTQLTENPYGNPGFERLTDAVQQANRLLGIAPGGLGPPSPNIGMPMFEAFPDPAAAMNVPGYLLPTRANYELLFADEMRNELIHRGVNNSTWPTTRSRLIDMLMTEDAKGNLGRAHLAGYRVITGNTTARARPRDFTYPFIRNINGL